MAALDPAPAPLLALPLSDAPGATFVITAEEIERSGAANIFELLRRVPGVDIRYTPMGGHIGIRSTGPSPFSEEVLLLIDGTPYNEEGRRWDGPWIVALLWDPPTARWFHPGGEPARCGN
jgi:outer membrane receptor for ferrienterochelin and colicin